MTNFRRASPSERDAAIIEWRIRQFWRGVAKSDGCWNWTRSKDKDGYGKFLYGRAHRFSWWLHTGQHAPRHLFVCHHCDNPSCVRPEHLFLGTSKQNVDDAIKKGRWNRGARHPSTKITVPMAAEILANYTGKYGERSALARRYGVAVNQITRVVSGKHWTSREVNP